METSLIEAHARSPLVVNETPQTNSAPEKVETEVELIWGVKVSLRDGVKLNATVYKPKPMSEPLPVIFNLTPYTGDRYHARADYFAKHGYVFVLVDSRGRGNSHRAEFGQRVFADKSFGQDLDCYFAGEKIFGD